MEYPAYPKRQASERSSGFQFQETGQPDRKPEIIIHIVGEDETAYNLFLQMVEDARRLHKSQDEGRFEYCIEYAEYYPKEETKAVIRPDRLSDALPPCHR